MATIKTTNEVVKELTERVHALEADKDSSAEMVQEAYADAARALLRMEDIGWSQLTGMRTETRYDVEQLHDISEKMREWSDTNPLLWRGNEIRCSYLFGNGYKIGTIGADTSISVRAQEDIDNPINQAALFSPEALAANEKARYTDGNLFACFSKAERRFQIVPFAQIEDAYTNPDDAGEVWFYKRTRESREFDILKNRFQEVRKSVWIPVDTFTPPKEVKTLKSLGEHPIDWDKVIVDSRVNRQIGETWGLPDAFAAAPWAIAYSSYLRDGTKVLAALAEWVWQIKPKTRAGGQNVGASVRSSDGPAKTIVSDMEMSALPKSDAVDLTTGRPIAAQVAGALGVSVVILLADPGQSGAFGTAQTLTDPTIRTMLTRRELNSQFLIRCLSLLKIKDPTILWEKMAQDPDHREMQTKVAAGLTGLFHEDEMREPIAELAGFTIKHESPPEGYMLPNNANSLARKDVDSDASPTSQANGQGGANASAKPSNSDNSLRDMDKDSENS